jgi:hypothetical protein
VLADAAKALGILDEGGRLQDAFFAGPLTQMRVMLTEPRRRAALLRALDGLLSAAPPRATEPARRRYPLAELDPHELSLTVDVVAPIADAVATLGLGARIAVTDGPTIDIDVPLVRGSGSSLTAVLGTADGPLTARMTTELADGVTLTVALRASADGGSFGLVLAGLVVDGTAVPPLEIDTGDLGDGAMALVLRVLDVAVSVLGGGDLGKHLLGLLGLDPAGPPLPIADLLAGPGTFRPWLASLVAGDRSGLRLWIGHLAGLAERELTATGLPTDAAPWTVAILDGPPAIALTVAVGTDEAGGPLLRVGLSVRHAAAGAQALADVAIVEAPLTGDQPERWFGSGRVALVAPAGPGPLLTTAALRVGSLSAGLGWAGGDIAPALELLDVELAPGTPQARPFARLDLTDADTLSETASNVLETALADALGDDATARAVAVLAGLEAVDGIGPVDPVALATSPTSTISAHHRALLDAGSWGPVLGALATLLDGDPAVAGTGSAAEPWTAAVRAGLALVAHTTADPEGRDLHLGLAVSVDGPDGAALTGRLALADVRFTAAGATIRFGGALRGALAMPATAGVLETSGVELGAGWVLGSSLTVGLVLADATLVLPVPDLPGEPVRVALGDVTLPFPAGADLGIPLPADARAEAGAALAALLVAGLDGFAAVPAALVAAAVPVLLARDLTELCGEAAATLRTVLGVAAEAAGETGPLLTELLTGPAVGAIGSGRAVDPWRRAARTGSPEGWLTATLGTSGPRGAAPAAVPAQPVGTGESVPEDDRDVDGPVAAEDARTADDRAVAELTAALVALGPQDSLLAGRDPGTLAAGWVALARWAAAGDGLVDADAATPTTAVWGEPIVGAGPATAPFTDPEVAAAVVGVLRQWAAVPVLVAPAWWPSVAFGPVVDGLRAADPALDAVVVDLREDVIGALGAVAPGRAYVVLAGAAADPAAGLDRIVAVTGSALAVLTVGTTAAQVLDWANDHRDRIAGVLAIGAPFAAGEPVIADPAAADACRTAALLLADDPRWGPLTTLWRDAVDDVPSPVPGWRGGAGALRLRDLTRPPSLRSVPVPRRMVRTRADGDLVAALATALAERATPWRPPDRLAFGIGGSLLTAAPSGRVRCTAEARLDLAAVALAVAGPVPATLTVRGEAAEPDGWLLGPPSAQVPVAVRRLVIEVTAPFGARPAAVRIELGESTVRGVRKATCTPADPEFGEAFAAVVARLDALPGQQAKQFVRLLERELGVLRRVDGGRAAVDATALEQLVADPTGWLSTRVVRLLADGGVLDLVPDLAAPSGLTRWQRTLGPALLVRLERDRGWELRVDTDEEGADLGDGARVRFSARARAGQPVRGTAALTVGGTVLSRTEDGTVRLELPGEAAPVVLAPVPEAEAAPALARGLSAVLGAAVVAALLRDGLGVPVPAGPLVGLLRSPGPTLARLFGTPAAAFGVLTDLAGVLGLVPDADSGRLALLPGVVDVVAAPADGGGLALRVATPDGGWDDGSAVDVEIAVGVDVAADGRAAPAGRAAVEVALDTGGQAGRWGRFALVVAASGGPEPVRLAVALDGGAEIELYPRFAGFGEVVGAAADRLLPQVLDLLADELAGSPVTDAVLAVATAAGIRGTTFQDGPVPLRALGPQTLRDRAAELVPAVVAAVRRLLDISDGAPAGALGVTAEGTSARLTIGGVLGGTVGVRVAFDPPGAAIELGGLAVGPVTLGLTAQGSAAGITGGVDVDVALDVLGIRPGPRLTVGVDAAGPAVTVLPLGPGSAAVASVQLAPQPGMAVSPDGIRQLVTRWAVAPGLRILLAALGATLDDPVIAPEPGAVPAPTWSALLEGAQLIDASGAVATALPEPLAAVGGLAAVLANSVGVTLAPGLRLELVGGDRLGLGLRGEIGMPSDGLEPTLLLGDGDGDAAGGGIGITVLRKVGATWTVAPALVLDRVGLRLTRDGGIVATPVFRLGGFDATVGTTVTLDGGLAATPPSAALALRGIGLPGLSGDTGNPYAAGMLAGSASESGNSPLDPALDVAVSWADRALDVDISGAEPGAPLWITVGRTFGPLTVNRIGVDADRARFEVDGRGEVLPFVEVLVDGALSMAGLTVVPQGLGVQIPPRYVGRPGVWKLDLEGLLIDFTNASVSITGGLVKDRNPVSGMLEYRGILAARAFGFGAAAIGAYARMPGGAVSMYVFATISAPLGGPPYLFITGVAGGFGVNRTLKVPRKPEAVGSFPLVRVMTGGRQDDLFKDMATSMAPAEGRYWLAAGIKFSTFALLNTVALGYVSFGQGGFEIGLLGLMSADLPSSSFAIARVELGLAAYYSSVENVLSARAQLTQNSWIFTEDCQLTGGFAIVVWFGKPQAVVTVGGYGPMLQVPDDFPQVDLVGFRWKVADGIVVKGGVYHAVVPQAMAFGGELEVSAKAGWGHGSLTVYAHAALWFWPPRFAINLGFRITGKAFGFGFDLSCDIFLQLPPFYARVRVNFLWGFEFEIGSPAPTAPFLPLDEFVRQHLGAADTLLGIVATAGELPEKDRKPTDSPHRVVPEFTVATTSVMPVLAARFGGADVARDAESLYALPIGVAAALDPVHEVRLRRIVGGQPVDLPAGAAAQLRVTVSRTGIPSSVWVQPTFVTLPFIPPVLAPPPDPLPVRAMRQAINGLVVRAEPVIVTPAALAPIAVTTLLDDIAEDLLFDPAPHGPPPAPDDGGPPVAPAAAELRAAAPRVRRRWSTHVVGAGDGAHALAADGDAGELQPGEVQVWDLGPGHTARVVAHGTCRVLALNPTGMVLADRVVEGAADPADLPQATGSFVVGMGADGAAGWQSDTLLRPVNDAVFVAVGALVELPTTAVLPLRLDPAAGIAARRVVAQAPGVCTRLQAGRFNTVVVALDPRRVDAPLADVTVGVDGGRLGRPEIVGAAAEGRVHLCYPVLESPGETLGVSVVIRPESWAVTGTVGVAGQAAAVAAGLAEHPWRSLLTGQSPAGPAVRVDVLGSRP